MKLDVLAFAAHPDDTELCCAGTIAALTRAGKKVGVVDLTGGEMGTRGTPKLRKKEAKKASEILGLSIRVNLGFKDTELENTTANRSKIIEQIRKYKPHVCLIGSAEDRHPDHGNATKMVLDALFYSGLSKIKINDLEPWRPAHILHYMQDKPFEPDFVFDISKTMDIKKEALLAFSSQFNVPKHSDDEPETYISGTIFFKQIEARARYFGHLAGFEFGEPFKYASKPIPLNNFNLFEETSPKR